MRIAAIVVTLSCALAAPAAAAAETADQKKARCAAQAGIVDRAVESRAGGAGIARTRAMLESGDEAVEAVYAPAVGPLVDWVYSLDEGELTAAAADAFETACLGY